MNLGVTSKLDYSSEDIDNLDEAGLLTFLRLNHIAKGTKNLNAAAKRLLAKEWLSNAHQRKPLHTLDSISDQVYAHDLPPSGTGALSESLLAELFGDAEGNINMKQL